MKEEKVEEESKIVKTGPEGELGLAEDLAIRASKHHEPEVEMIDTSSKPANKPELQKDPEEETKDQPKPKINLKDDGQSFEVIQDLEESFEEIKNEKQDEASYEVINNHSLRQLELDLLSNIDPDDEFL